MEIEAAENSEDGQLVDLKCPVCRHRAVDWHPPTPRRVKSPPPAVEPERAADWFKKIRETVNCL